MNLFSKEKLLKLVGSAKKHWWIFLPVLLLLMIGYLVFSISDAIHILALHIRNFFLAGFMLIRKCLRGIALFCANMAKGIANAVANRRSKISQSIKSMSSNATIARTQLLNSAVEYCTKEAQRRKDKKQRLNEIARELKSDTIPELVSPE